MATVLNRKFDMLCQSGTCPLYLVDVLSLLVAHVNDTELFKSELRTACDPHTGSHVVGGHGGFCATSSSSGVGGSHRAPCETSGDRAASVNSKLSPPHQPGGSASNNDELRAAHESLLVATERSLQNYAEDLKNINDVARATSAKELRTMRMEAQQEMERFRRRVCSDVVEQVNEELEMARSDALLAVREDMQKKIYELDQMCVSTQLQVRETTDAYSDFVARTYSALTLAPLSDAHEAEATMTFVKEKLRNIEASMATSATTEMLGERLKDMERVVASLSSNSNAAVDTTAAGANYTSLVSNTPIALPLPPLSDAPEQQSAEELRRSSPSQASAGNALTTLMLQQAAQGRLPEGAMASTAAASPSPPENSVFADRFGVTVKAGEEGVTVVRVRSGSTAAAHELHVGHIVSHIGRAAVTTPAGFEEALRAHWNQHEKFTVYDPLKGRVRLLTIQLD